MALRAGAAEGHAKGVADERAEPKAVGAMAVAAEKVTVIEQPKKT